MIIPKKEGAKKVGNFRSISVLNVSIKIISKILANRLRDVMGHLLDDHQSGFLKVICTLDSITIAQEVIQFNKRKKISGFMLKLDF